MRPLSLVQHTEIRGTLRVTASTSASSANKRKVTLLTVCLAVWDLPNCGFCQELDSWIRGGRMITEKEKVHGAAGRALAL